MPAGRTTDEPKAGLGRLRPVQRIRLFYRGKGGRARRGNQTGAATKYAKDPARRSAGTKKESPTDGVHHIKLTFAGTFSGMLRNQQLRGDFDEHT